MFICYLIYKVGFIHHSKANQKMHSPVILFSDIDHLVVKHNNLIEAKTQLSEIENKVVSLAVVLTRLHAKSPERDIRIDSTIRIYASDYMKTYSTPLATAYTAINDAMDSLFDRYFTMQSKDGIPTEYRWIQSKGKGEGKGPRLNDGFVEFTFSEKAIELITGLENGNYTSYGIERISRLKGNYSGRIYELIIKYKNTEADKSTRQRTTKIFELELFRELLGIEDHEYRDTKKPGATRMDNFKKKVIDTSVETINAESDITATAIYHRTGRSITGLSFSFEFKKDYVPSFLRNENNAQGPGEMRTIGDETKDPKKTKPKDAPALPTVKDDKEHLGTDLRTEDLKDKVNPVQDHIVDFKDLVKPVPADKKKELDVHSIPGHLYSKYEEVGGTLSIEKLTEKCRASTKTAGHFMLTEIAELKKQA